MISGRTGRLIASFCMAIAVALTAQAASAQSRSERGVYDRLAQYGITPDQVVELNIYPRRDGNDRVQRSEAWVRVEQCPQGWVVMTVGRTGVVTYAYTRDGCSIPGLDEA